MTNHDVFRTRQSSLDQHLPWLDDQWAAGCQNGAELWRRLKARGFRGSLRVISEWATRRRRAETADVENLRRIPSARTIARLMTVGRDTLSKAETVTVAAVEAGVPTLVEAREIIAEFHGMIRRRAAAELSSWIERARASLVASFTRGVTNLEAAVRAGITSPWSNGQTEGQITRLKLVNGNVRPRQNRSASGQADRRSMKGAAPKVRQSQYCMPNDTLSAAITFSVNQPCGAGAVLGRN